MTVCNMSIEGGARAGMIAPDDTTFNYLNGRPFAPKGKAWDEAVSRWSQLKTDEGSKFDREVIIDGDALEPMITWGTNPGMGVSINAPIPAAASPSDTKALEYMGLESGKPLAGHPINVVFIGSCTNSRISDLRSAAALLKGRKVNPNVRVMVVPGSMEVKRQAEAEGLPALFRAAGCDYREPGCSMCIAMNGDQLQPGEYSVSTSNRNFEGRQGKGGRTFLASPLTAAASALTGVVTDVRTLL
jgi:3-isopropylmalate/(R)-2-methylmalate dehydratase large subunit